MFDRLFVACLEECWMVFAITRALKNEYFEKSWLVNAPPFRPFPPIFHNISSCSSFYYNSPPIPPFRF